MWDRYKLRGQVQSFIPRPSLAPVFCILHASDQKLEQEKACMGRRLAVYNISKSDVHFATCFPTYLTVFLGLYILQLPSPVTCSMVPPLLPKIRKIILYSRPFILCANTAWLVKLLRGGCHIKCLLNSMFVYVLQILTPRWTSVTSVWHPCVALRAWDRVLCYSKTKPFKLDTNQYVSCWHQTQYLKWAWYTHQQQRCNHLLHTYT